MVKQNKIKQNPMGYEDVLSLLIKMSLPIMLSMLIQSLYNITDSYFVAQFSEKALRATSLSYPVQVVIIGFGVGTGVGINSYISRALGAGDEERVNQGAMHGLLLVIFSWLIFITFRFTFLDTFFDRFTTDPEVKRMGIEYLGLITSFSFLSLLQITIEKILQATGYTIGSMIVQGVGAIVNIVLDPIMIFGLLGFPKMGIRGAAIATLIGQGSGALVGIFMLLKGKTDIDINFKKFKFSSNIIKNIYTVGFPSILMQSVTAIVTTIMNLIVMKHSELAVSVLGIYIKLESFVLMPVLGIGQGVLPIIGYNYGSKDKERVGEAYKYGVILAVLVMSIGTLLFQFVPDTLMGIFTDDLDMINMGVYAIRIISLGYIMAGVIIINSSYFQALGLGNLSLLVTSLRQIVIIIPLAYLFSFISLNTVWIAYPIAELVAFIVSIFLQRRVKKRKIDIL